MDWILLLVLVIINVLLCLGLYISAELEGCFSRFSMNNLKKSSRSLTDTIFISVGTSSQCTVLSDEEISNPVHPYAEKRYFHPRFGKLMCAASLNGGNVIDHFVKAGLKNFSKFWPPKWKQFYRNPEKVILHRLFNNSTIRKSYTDRTLSTLSRTRKHDTKRGSNKLDGG